jgi:hypothetical protein
MRRNQCLTMKASHAKRFDRFKSPFMRQLYAISQEIIKSTTLPCHFLHAFKRKGHKYLAQSNISWTFHSNTTQPILLSTSLHLHNPAIRSIQRLLFLDICENPAMHAMHTPPNGLIIMIHLCLSNRSRLIDDIFHRFNLWNILLPNVFDVVPSQLLG